MIPVRRLSDAEPRRAAELPLEATRQIIERVRHEGDAAVRELTMKFDGPEPPDGGEVPEPLRRAIDQVCDRVARFHEKGMITGFEFAAGPGTYLGEAVVPYARVGIYAPGGRATYPSTVIMAATPARIAGVSEIILATPNPSAAVRYAAGRCGVDRIFRMGGAQAIAAMALGTATVPRVDIIVGPGNAYVTAAKKLLADEVAIDFLAGPTEILILWDGSGSADLVAVEMAAQAEHAPDSCAILVTATPEAAAAADRALEKLVPTLDRTDVVRQALGAHGRIFVGSADEAVAFANAYAPEHLLLMGKIMEAHLSSVRTAGAVSSGTYASVALADYGSGPNHILPTMGDARRKSALSVRTFLRTMPYQRISAEGLRTLAPAAIELARAEGLTAHARAIEMRLS